MYRGFACGGNVEVGWGCSSLEERFYLACERINPFPLQVPVHRRPRPQQPRPSNITRPISCPELYNRQTQLALQQRDSAKMASQSPPPVVLYGYDASPFTLKIRMALRLKQIPYYFVPVSVTMPRPWLRNTLGLTYRKIPVLSIGKEVYCDTSLIGEALEMFFPPVEGWGALYPLVKGGQSRAYRSLMRGLSQFWTDRPLFNAVTGLIPAAAWRGSFGRDREAFVGHTIDADKMAANFPATWSSLDLHLSWLEPALSHQDGWIFNTSQPGLADISLFSQLKWSREVVQGSYTADLVGGDAAATDYETTVAGFDRVFNPRRYPGVFTWFRMMERYFEELPNVEITLDQASFEKDVVQQMRASRLLGRKSLLLPTPSPSLTELDEMMGLKEGAEIKIVPNDTGRDR